MPDRSSDLVQGTLDMLILKTLALEPMHGYGIAVRLEQMTIVGVVKNHKYRSIDEDPIPMAWYVFLLRSKHGRRTSGQAYIIYLILEC